MKLQLRTMTPFLKMYELQIEIKRKRFSADLASLAFLITSGIIYSLMLGEGSTQ